MARSRRGSFGLQPRVAPNVTNQIIALSREYVAKRDVLIMDAWRSGGTFEGKKATDEMVLGYWKERGKGLDKDDPTYEQAQNQIMQLTYGIEQSKADVLHVQGKLSDRAYAQFFINWAKKVPRNSEFYRTLQKDAAQLIEAAKARGRAGAEAARTNAFNAFVKRTTEQDIAIGDAMIGALNNLSKATGISITGNGPELLAMLTSDIKANPGQYNILLDTLRKGDPSFDGNLTEGYFNQHIKAAAHGYEQIADRAHKDGYVSAYVSASAGQAEMTKAGQNIKVWPVADSYSMAENSWAKIMSDPTSSIIDREAASAAFSAALTHLANTPGIDAASKTMIAADAARLLGQDAGDVPSFGGQMLGRPGVSPEAAMQLGAWAQQKAEQDANPTAWAYAPVDATGHFDPTGQGPIGRVPAGQVQPGAQAVMVPGSGGVAVLAMVMPHSVYVTDPAHPDANPRLAGYQISYNVGGRAIQLWNYQDAAGQPHWRAGSPLSDGATATTDDKGNVFVTPKVSVDPAVRAAQIDAQYGTNLASQIGAAGAAADQGITVKQNVIVDGKITGYREVTYENGVFSATQHDTVKAGDVTSVEQGTPIDLAAQVPGTATAQGAAFRQSLLSAGNVPGSYSSVLQASVSVAGYTQTQDQVNKYASDPAFQQAFLSQTMGTLGINNPYDPRVATAWRNITTGHIDDVRHGQLATDREDLKYPGAATAAVSASTPGITFGHPELVLPKLPGGGDMRDSFDRGGQDRWAGIQPQVLPGLGSPLPSQMPAGSPAPSIAPTPQPAPTPTSITPMPTATPTALVPNATPLGTTLGTTPYRSPYLTSKMKTLETQ